MQPDPNFEVGGAKIDCASTRQRGEIHRLSTVATLRLKSNVDLELYLVLGGHFSTKISQLLFKV